MELEADAGWLAIAVFVTIIMFCIVYFTNLWRKSKNSAFGLFIIQTVALTICFVIFMVHSAKIFYIPKTMLSETNSMVLASIGLFWIISMICMVAGITMLYKTEKYSSKD